MLLLWQPSNFQDDKTEESFFTLFNYLLVYTTQEICNLFCSQGEFFWLNAGFEKGDKTSKTRKWEQGQESKAKLWPRSKPLSCCQIQNGGRLIIVTLIFKIPPLLYFCSRNKVFQNSIATVIWKARLFYIHHETWNRLLHRIQFQHRMEINQKSYSRENFSSFPLSHPIKFPRHLWPLSDIFQLRRLAFWWRSKVPLWKKPAVQTIGGTCRARRHARGHKLQTSRHRLLLFQAVKFRDTQAWNW